MTDLQKYKNFLDNMNIEYTENKYFETNITELLIAEKHICYGNCGNYVSILFRTSNGSFIQFHGWSEGL